MSIKQPRFFSENRILSDAVALDGDEAHHLLHVLRAQVGQEFVLFDGSGQEFDAVVTRTERRIIHFEIRSVSLINRELPTELTIAISLPKGDRQKTLIEKLVELGATRLIPVITERSVAQPTDAAVQRLQKQVIAASKQSGRNQLMEIGGAQPLSAFIADCSSARRLIADPSAESNWDNETITANSVTVLIGPEGGFAPAELQAALVAGWKSVGLGPRILRVETAALMATALIANQAERK